MKQEPLLILVRGLPGSGKSTLAEMLHNCYVEKNRDCVTLAADDYMINEKGVYSFDHRKLSWCHESCQLDTEAFLSSDYVVIVHNTFTEKWEVEPYLAIAAKYSVPVQVLTVQGPWVNTHGCPDSKIEQMKERWDWNVLA